MGINNPFESQYGLGARIADEGILSRFRWYDPLMLVANPMVGGAIIAGREGYEEVMRDADLPEPIDGGKKAAPPPDFTDEMVMRAAKLERDRNSTKQGRRQSFVTGQSASSTFFGSY